MKRQVILGAALMGLGAAALVRRAVSATTVEPFEFRNGVALVTGAASGIGRALAEGLAARGCHLALVDRNAAGLEAVAAQARQRGVRVSTHPFDLSKLEDIGALVNDVIAQHGRVTLLINNAGVALGGRFEEVSLEEFEWLMSINFRAVVALTKACLPYLLREGGAHLVNVSSVFGLVAPEGQTAYSASKFAVRGFTEALRHELEGRLSVSVVHPGGVKTNIALGARVAVTVDPVRARQEAEQFDKGLRTLPGDAAETILRATERRQGRVLIGVDARLIDVIQRLWPIFYWRILKSLF